MNPSAIQEAMDRARRHHHAGELQEAEAVYRQILAADHNQPDALHSLGLVALQCGKLTTASELIARAIAVAPQAADFHSNLAEVQRQLGQLQAAETSARRAIAAQPGLAAAYANLAAILLEGQRLDEAESALHRAIELQPDLAMALAALSHVLVAKDDFESAITMARRAVGAAPNLALAHNNLGTALERNGQLDQAVLSYRRAHELAPACAQFLCNLGLAIRRTGDIQQAMRYWAEAARLQPDYADAHVYLALSHLALGDFERGWKMYEWRWAKNKQTAPQPAWDGSDPAGRTFILHAEQGFGDTIQFVRYAPLLAARGAKVIVQCRQELVSLINEIPMVQAIPQDQQTLPDHDYRMSLMNFPLVFGTTLQSVPREVPYIKIDPLRQRVWKDRLENDPSILRIGLVWAGNPKLLNDASRSIPLRLLETLLDLPNIKFYSLQKGAAASQLSAVPFGSHIGDLSADLHEFRDTAAAIANLDLVVAVDTAVAHLAGAIAAPTWTLIPFVADFRWLIGCEDSPWYPTMRLFRQTTAGDWTIPVSRMGESLKKLQETPRAEKQH